MEEKINLNFSIPVLLSLDIDRHLLSLKEKGVKKTKSQLLTDLLFMGLKEVKK